MHDVLAHFVVRQRLQVEGHRHALRQLAQVRALQQRAQFRLAHQDHVQQVVFLRVHVGEHADLFQTPDAEVLGLVDDQHHRPARPVLESDPFELETVNDLGGFAGAGPSARWP